jgi:hypothetical protein
MYMGKGSMVDIARDWQIKGVKDDNVSRGPYFCSHTELKSEYFNKCEQAQN